MSIQQNIPNDLDSGFRLPRTASSNVIRACSLRPRTCTTRRWTVARSFDGSAGLWCVNAGHAREKIVSALQQNAATLDYAPPFQFGNPMAFELATRITELTPDPLNRIFFTNSGSRPLIRR